jgi:hypothetical protein
MKRSPLEHVKHLIKKLSAEDRQQVIPYLAQFSDSGVQSYDLREEAEALKKHGTLLAGDSPDAISIVFLRDLVEIRVAGRKVLHARFFAKDFAEAFPDYMSQLEWTANAYKERYLEPEAS